jgi:uncharacterized phage-associated protein
MPEILPHGIVHGYPDEDAFLDSRSIANRLLDLCEENRLVGEDDLQALLYFSHGLHLMRTGKHLIYGDFEAHDGGPRLPSMWSSMRGIQEVVDVDTKGRRVFPPPLALTPEDRRRMAEKRRNHAISYRFLRRDIARETVHRAEGPTHPEVLSTLFAVVETYGRLPSRDLRALACAQGAPWHFTVEQAKTTLNLGMQISDETIRERFKFHKRVIPN